MLLLLSSYYAIMRQQSGILQIGKYINICCNAMPFKITFYHFKTYGDEIKEANIKCEEDYIVLVVHLC